MDGKSNAQQKSGHDMGHEFPLLQRTAPSASTTYTEKCIMCWGKLESGSAFPITMNNYVSSIQVPNKACIPDFYLKSMSDTSTNHCIIPTADYLKQLMIDLGIVNYLTQDYEYVVRIGYTTDPTQIKTWSGFRGDIRFRLNAGNITFVYDLTNYNKIYGNASVAQGDTVYFFVELISAVN